MLFHRRGLLWLGSAVATFGGSGAVRSFTGMDRNGPDYRNGLPEWAFICVLEDFSFGF